MIEVAPLLLELFGYSVDPIIYTMFGYWGGGGGDFHAYWVCAARETSIFSTKFPIWSISFSQITKQICSGASPFYIFCLSGDHHLKNFFNFNPLIAIHGRLTAASMNTKRSGSAPGLAAGQSASQTRPTVSSGDPHFHARAHSVTLEPRIFTLELAPEPRIFTLKLTPEPPIFHFVTAHTCTYQIWGEYLPRGYSSSCNARWWEMVVMLVYKNLWGY